MLYTKRYIEVSSAYRDRSRYRNPAQFNVELSLTRQRLRLCYKSFITLTSVP